MLVFAGYDETVSSLIFNGANVNEISDGETTLLHVAAAAGNLFSMLINMTDSQSQLVLFSQDMKK